LKTSIYCPGKSRQKGAALIIVLAFIVLLTVLSLTYFSRTTIDRQLAQSSFNDTGADLLARSALDIVLSDLKQEIINNPTVNTTNIQPASYGTPAAGETPIPNLIRRSFSGAPASRASIVSSTAVSANGRSISTARWNSHYLIPRGNTGTTIDSSPFRGARLGAGNCSGSNTRACAKCCDWKIRICHVRRGRFARYESGGICRRLELGQR
jgi:Tfp pilus assembly protein PilX